MLRYSEKFGEARLGDSEVFSGRAKFGPGLYHVTYCLQFTGVRQHVRLSNLFELGTLEPVESLHSVLA